MKYSMQREMILKYLKSVYSHPTAEIIYNELRKDYPNLSLGTVYRNLEKLASNGEILRIKLANTKDRFDGNTNNHYHAICIKCGEITDIFDKDFSYIDRDVEKSINCSVLSHVIIFNTICPKCK